MPGTLLEKLQGSPILLVKLRGIGDSVLSLPSVSALKKLAPGSALDLLVPPASVGVFSEDRRVRRIWVYDKNTLGVAGYASLVKRLRGQNYGLAFCPHASFRTALLGRLSGAGLRSVRNHSGRDWFNNVKCATPKEPKSIVEREFDALRALGWQGAPPAIQMALGLGGKRWAQTWWAGRKLAKGKVTLLVPGGSVSERRWSPRRFAELAQALAKAKKAVAWITAPGEAYPAPPVKGLLQAQPPNVQALGALAALAGRLIGNNSGPRHVAAACGARTLTLFASDLPREWHPYRQKDGHLYLRPASGRLEDLTVQEVLTAYKHL